MKYAGIDLHSNNCVVSVIDETDRVLAEHRVGNEMERVIAVLQPHRSELVGVVVESTFNWYWLVDGLQDRGFVVHLANTAAMQTYSGLKHSDDRHDARHLAHLLRLGVLPTGFIYPKTQRAARWSCTPTCAWGCKRRSHWWVRSSSRSGRWRSVCRKGSACSPSTDCCRRCRALDRCWPR